MSPEALCLLALEHVGLLFTKEVRVAAPAIGVFEPKAGTGVPAFVARRATGHVDPALVGVNLALVGQLDHHQLE